MGVALADEGVLGVRRGKTTFEGVDVTRLRRGAAKGKDERPIPPIREVSSKTYLKFEPGHGVVAVGGWV